MQTFSSYKTTGLEYCKTVNVMKIKKSLWQGDYFILKEIEDRITTCRAFTLLGSHIKNRGSNVNFFRFDKDCLYRTVSLVGLKVTKCRDFL